MARKPQNDYQMKLTIKWLCWFLLPLASGKVWAQAPSRPNIVFILADDLGYTDLGCYGHPYHETPFLDSLASKGLRFTQAYAASPVCSPSRAAILTGKHPARLHLTNFLVGERTDPQSPVLPAPWQKFLPAAEVTLAEHLQRRGYQTGMVGKWHLGGPDSLAPWNQGFAYSRLIGKNGLDYYHYSVYEGSYQREFVDHGQHYLTDKLTDYGVEFIRQQGPQAPFFLYLAYSAPHVLLVPKAQKLKKYLFKYEKYEGRYNPDYAAMLESLDEGVRRIVAQLAAQNLLDNTLVVFTSDNGGVGLPELGPMPTDLAPLRKWKGHVYEGGIRVPAICFWPKVIAPQQVCSQYFTNTDYLPTFLEILGERPDPALDGQSFWPLLQHPQQERERGPIYWHYPHFSNQLGRPAAAVRLGDWKLVESYETGQMELFNLAEDVGEARDLAQAQPRKVQELHQLLIHWRAQVGANLPVRK
jgi:arylsulfatase A